MVPKGNICNKCFSTWYLYCSVFTNGLLLIIIKPKPSQKDYIQFRTDVERDSRGNNCGVGLELKCSDERQKMKFIAIKSILKAQQLLKEAGHSCETMHFIHIMAQVSSLTTRSAKYLAIHDAMVSESPIFTPFDIECDEDFSYNEMGRLEYEVCKNLFQIDKSSKRARIR